MLSKGGQLHIIKSIDEGAVLIISRFVIILIYGPCAFIQSSHVKKVAKLRDLPNRGCY